MPNANSSFYSSIDLHFYFQLGNHDTHRIATKVGKKKVDGLNMLTAFLPGVQVTYQGEEIGMINGAVKCKEEGKDLNNDCDLYPKISRDFERTPFHWSPDKNAGFSEGDHPWLPIAKNYQTTNVKTEDDKPFSHLNIYRNVQKVKAEISTNCTNTVEIVSSKDNLLHLRRLTDSVTVYDYLFNLNDTSTNVTLNARHDEITVLAASIGTKTLG